MVPIGVLSVACVAVALARSAKHIAANELPPAPMPIFAIDYETTIVVGAPGTSLAFGWVFYSFDGGSSTYQDFVFVSLMNSVGGVVSLDLLALNPTGPYSVATSTALNIVAADTYTLGFGVLDEEDTIFSSMFLLDNVTLGGTAIADGSFESGFGTWSTVGDTAIVGSFGGGRPPRQHVQSDGGPGAGAPRFERPGVRQLRRQPTERHPRAWHERALRAWRRVENAGRKSRELLEGLTQTPVTLAPAPPALLTCPPS